jgi:hypothetical protein
MPGLDDAQAFADQDIIVDIEGPPGPTVHDDGTIETPTEDGGVVIQFNALTPFQQKPDKFSDNVAGKLSADQLSRIAETLIEQIEADIKSRDEWMRLRARAIDLLGFKIEDPKADVGASSSPMEGMSTLYDPLLAEAVVKAHATAQGELLPAEGPVKCTNSGVGNAATEGQAEALEKDLNYWLTTVAPEYYPDTKRMLFWTVFGGSGFKKGYHCPIKRRPTIESVDAKDCIVAAGATDMTTAARVTHRLEMRPSLMRRMQIVGAYRDIPLVPSTQATKDMAQTATERVVGVSVTGQERPEDTPFEIYETYAEVEIDELAPTQFKGKRLPLPFKVTIEVQSRQILEIRRDWIESDPICLRKKTWVKYPYIEALSFYCLGLMHLVGNLTNALSAGGREALDAGMMANFPGLLIAKWAARQQQEKTNLRVNAGEAAIIDTGERPIGEGVMGMPYHDVTAGLLGVLAQLTEKGKSLAGTAEFAIGEGRQNAPVGTTIALIEQATQIETAVHKGMHTAQSEEFMILRRLFTEHPESFWEHNPDATINWDIPTFLAALRNTAIAPRADPNVPSHIHRLLKAMALKQLQSQNPGLYDGREVDKRILTGIGWQDVDALFVKPPPPGTPPPPPDPNQVTAQAKMISAQAQTTNAMTKQQQVQAEGQQKMQELAAEKDIENQRIAKELIIHSDTHSLGQAGHALDAITAGHDAALGAASHALDASQHGLDVHQALNPPEPTSTS